MWHLPTAPSNWTDQLQPIWWVAQLSKGIFEVSVDCTTCRQMEANNSRFSILQNCKVGTLSFLRKRLRPLPLNILLLLTVSSHRPAVLIYTTTANNNQSHYVLIICYVTALCSSLLNIISPHCLSFEIVS